MVETAGYLASVLIGLSLGMIGGGGSILTVPILVYLFAIDPIPATTYSLIIVGLTSGTGAVSQLLKGNVEVKTAFLFGIPSFIVVFIMRKWIMPGIPDHLFPATHFSVAKSTLMMFTFAGLMLASSLSMIRNKKADAMPAAEPNYLKLILQSMLVGLVTGFVGVGGGFLIIPSLVLFAGLPMKKAVGTSLLIMTISSLLGVSGDLSHDVDLNYLFIAKFTAFAALGIITGMYLTRYINETRLKHAFGWFVLVMGTFILVSTLIK